MPEVIEFFLKMDTGRDADSTLPPYILHFGLQKARIEEIRRQGEAVIKGLRQQRPFANASHAAQYTIANSILANELGNPDIRQVLSVLLVHLATDTQDKRDALATGAKRVGFLIAPSPQALAHTPENGNADASLVSLLKTGISPFRFRFAALMPA